LLLHQWRCQQLCLLPQQQSPPLLQQRLLSRGRPLIYRRQQIWHQPMTCLQLATHGQRQKQQQQ
jgi:hypothetical protein